MDTTTANWTPRTSDTYSISIPDLVRSQRISPATPVTHRQPNQDQSEQIKPKPRHTQGTPDGRITR